jgi:hypothetical protein
MLGLAAINAQFFRMHQARHSQVECGTEINMECRFINSNERTTGFRYFGNK